MKLICLNIWGGKIYQPLMNFIKKNSKDTDIFCFQEVFDTKSNIIESSGFKLDIYKNISEILPFHQGFFYPSLENYIAGSFQPEFVDFDVSWGLAIFIKNNFKIIQEGEFFVYRNKGSFNPRDFNSLPRNVQYVVFKKDYKTYTVCNMHGIWLKEGKNDSPSRIFQSKQVKDFLDKQKGEKILAGDFNLNPNTASIKILEKSMRNLIKEYNILTTRNALFPREEKFADYIFVSEDVKIIDFQVPKINISDHLPMILEFS